MRPVPLQIEEQQASGSRGSTATSGGSGHMTAGSGGVLLEKGDSWKQSRSLFAALEAMNELGQEEAAGGAQGGRRGGGGA